MGMRGTVVSRQAWRRWGVVLAVVAVLCSVPIVLNVWPARAAALDPQTLRQRMLTADRPYQGFAQSAGLLPLPSLPNLEQVTDLVSTTNDMRVWYAARDRWRVDILDGATERDTYRTPEASYVWDSGDTTLTEIFGEQPIRLPAAADLTPPALVRRILSLAREDRVEPLAGRRRLISPSTSAASVVRCCMPGWWAGGVTTAASGVVSRSSRNRVRNTGRWPPFAVTSACTGSPLSGSAQTSTWSTVVSAVAGTIRSPAAATPATRRPASGSTRSSRARLRIRRTSSGGVRSAAVGRRIGCSPKISVSVVSPESHT